MSYCAKCQKDTPDIDGVAQDTRFTTSAFLVTVEESDPLVPDQCAYTITSLPPGTQPNADKLALYVTVYNNGSVSAEMYGIPV